VHELIAADGDPHVRRSWRDGREEKQIARGHFAVLHRFPLLKLIPDFARQGDAVSGEHVLGKSAAIEPVGIDAAVPVRRPAKRQRRTDQGVAVYRFVNGKERVLNGRGLRLRWGLVPGIPLMTGRRKWAGSGDSSGASRSARARSWLRSHSMPERRVVVRFIDAIVG
jgi:hypothetical protein